MWPFNRSKKPTLAGVIPGDKLIALRTVEAFGIKEGTVYECTGFTWCSLRRECLVEVAIPGAYLPVAVQDLVYAPRNFAPYPETNPGVILLGRTGNPIVKQV